MSDFSIPGVKSGIGTNEMVKAIMDVERVRLDSMKNEVTDFEQQKEAWQDLNLKLSRLKDSASALYGFQNPFNEKISISSNENVLTATVSREAMEQEARILVKQIAKADRFVSSSQNKDYKAPAGTYVFQIGEKEVDFKFNGGSLEALADAINKKTNKLLRASVINDTSKTKVIVIEGTKAGSKNKLNFLDKALDFAIEAGIIERSNNTARDISFSESTLIPVESGGDSLYTIKEGTLGLKPGAQAKLPITPEMNIGKGMVLELEMVIEELAVDSVEETNRPPGPKMPSPGELVFQDLVLEFEKSEFILPSWEPPKPPEKIEDMNILSLGDRDTKIALPPFNAKPQTQKITIPLDEYTASLDALYFDNKNTHKVISFQNIRIFDPDARGDFKPVNPLDQARDAVIELDGIEIRRETNEIDDLLAGVNLTLRSESETPVDFKVTHDTELIKESIVTFVGRYNEIITTIDVLSRYDESFLSSLEYLTDEEKDKYKEQMGLLQGESTLMFLKRSIQNTMMNPYRTGEQNDLKLLAQLGIATNLGSPGSSGALNKVTLRGYYQIDEDKLDEAVTRYKEDVKELFGWDSDGDLIVDTGLAYSMDQGVRPYTSTGGILTTKLSTIDSRITRRNEDIEEYNNYLEDKEAQLKRQFSTAEGMMQALQQNSTALENFNKQNSGSN